MPPAAHVRLPRSLIPALMLLASGAPPPPAPPDAVRRLERLHLAHNGNATQEGRRIVADMTEARLVVSVECITADLPYHSTIWSRDASAVWGRPVDGEVFELRRIEPVEIPLLLAQITGVGQRPQTPFTGSVVIPADAWRAAQSHEHDQETSFGVLVSSGLEPVWADRLLIAVAHRRVEWTISSVWTDPDGSHGVHETCVLDAGPAGYWHIDRNDAGGTVKLTVGSLQSVLRSMRCAVPDWCRAVNVPRESTPPESDV